MSRLTDEELVKWSQSSGHSEAVYCMVDELRERRAADLSDEDADALKFARERCAIALNPVEDDGCPCTGCESYRRALSVLDRLLSHAGGDK